MVSSSNSNSDSLLIVMPSSLSHCGLVILKHKTGDINRPEVLNNFNVGEAKACVFTIDDMAATNKASRTTSFI